MNAARILAAGALGAALACGGDDGAPAGEAQGPCYPNDTCNEGLWCHEGTCVSPSGEGSSDAGPDDGDADAGASAGADPDPVCEVQYSACIDGETIDELLPCVHDYTVCRFGDAPSCDQRVQACEELGLVTECAEGWPGCFDPTGGTDGTTDGGGVDDGSVDTGSVDDDGDDGGVCAPPACSTYDAKMTSCYPKLSIDWYAECLDIYDICDIGGTCFDGTPGIIACRNSTPCEDVVDGACNGVDGNC